MQLFNVTEKLGYLLCNNLNIIFSEYVFLSRFMKNLTASNLLILFLSVTLNNCLLKYSNVNNDV